MRPVKKDWVATGGNRAAATVQLSFEHYPLEKAEVSEQQALNIARERCKNWGYSAVEAFEGVINRRDPFTGIVLVAKEYQRLGRGDSTTPNEGKK